VRHEGRDMATRKSVQRIWHGRESGLVVPQGIVSDLSKSSSQTYLQIKEKAFAVEQLYAASYVPLATASDLGRLIADAKELSDSWLMGQAEKHPMTLLFRVGLFDRIADAVLPLLDVLDRRGYLISLASGSLDLLERKRSNAKDVLWELELWAILKRASFDATPQEPPDIVVHFGETKIGIACKKLYSEKHVQNVLSQAVAQIEASFDFGIIAVNIDDLVPPNKILKTPTHETLSQYIRELNARFLAFHERHFRKYLASGRVISVLVSTSVLADVFRNRPRFNHARQSTVWTIPGLPLQKARELRKFYDRLMV
jgi:hypothetical protein